MSDFPYALGSSSAGSVQETVGPSEGAKPEENPTRSLTEFQQAQGELPGSPLSEVPEGTPDLSVVGKQEEETTRSIERMEQEGVFMDADGDGIPDYRDVTGNESRFGQEAAKGTTGAMEALRAMMGSILGFSLRPEGPKPEEAVSEISKTQGGNLQTTMAATHRNRVTTEFDVGVPVRTRTAQKRKDLFHRVQKFRQLGHVEKFYRAAVKVGDRSRVGDDVSKPR